MAEKASLYPQIPPQQHNPAQQPPYQYPGQPYTAPGQPYPAPGQPYPAPGQPYAGAPPQQYVPQGGYPMQPPPPYAAQGTQQVHVHHTYVQPLPVNRGLTGSIGGLFSAAGKAAKGAVDSAQKGVDLYASSASLSMFRTGNIVQLISKVNNLALRVLPNGEMDCLGNPAVNDGYTHFKVFNQGHNIVTLNCMANPTFFLTILKDGRILGNGDGKYESKFRLHETLKGFMTFESLSFPTNHIGVLPNGQMLPGNAKGKGEYAQFSVRLLNSMVHTVPTHTTIIVHQK